jgi:hypothetical protein
MAKHASYLRDCGYALNGLADYSTCAASSGADTGRATCGASIGAIGHATFSAVRRKREGFVGGRSSAAKHCRDCLAESHSCGFPRSERKTIRVNCAYSSACHRTT